jgi:DNA-binding MarR family transcriptional regulator
MNDNPFFKPTPLYKEFMILDLIEKNPSLTQREIGDAIGVAVSMVNAYLDEYEEKGYITRTYKSSKSVDYNITKAGIERKEVLNIGFLKSAQQVYALAKENIVSFLNQIIERGFTTILLYGAGEVAEILVHVIQTDMYDKLGIVSIIDDDVLKQNTKFMGIPIISFEKVQNIFENGILIANYTYNDRIYTKLVTNGINQKKIIQFFNLRRESR